MGLTAGSSLTVGTSGHREGTVPIPQMECLEAYKTTKDKIEHPEIQNLLSNYSDIHRERERERVSVCVFTCVNMRLCGMCKGVCVCLCVCVCVCVCVNVGI